VPAAVGLRGFRVDRIEAAVATAETAPRRDVDLRPELDRIRARPLRS
jgi:hypothetical protein